MLAEIYDAFKADGFRPRKQVIGFGPDDDMSILLHPEVPECLWFVQFQKRLDPKSKARAYWSPLGGSWILL